MNFLEYLVLFLLVHIFILIYVRLSTNMRAKMILFYWLCSICSLFFLIPMMWTGKNLKNYMYPMGTLRLLVRSFGLNIKIKNKEYVDIEGAAVIVLNHQSSIDMFPVAEIWPERCSILAKKEFKWAGPFGLMSQLCNTIFIDRANANKAKTTMSHAAEQVKERNMKVVIFPEGTRNKGRELLPFKKGAFNLAVEAQIPVIPVVISSYHHFYKHDEGIFASGDVTVTCLPPMSTRGMTMDDVPQLAISTREAMSDVLHQS